MISEKVELINKRKSLIHDEYIGKYLVEKIKSHGDAGCRAGIVFH